MELASEDLLRLNVMLAHDVQAVRIDESSMTVHGLAGDTEASILLNPNCRPEQYLRRVRELLSSHALGSPGGYPVFLQRWTRMGQQRGSQLDKLLLLGEPEAVIAVAGAPELTDELARRAWWCDPTMDNARRMLANPAIVQGQMGRTLAEFLVEHLPFETDHLAVIITIKLILQPELIDEATRLRIWSRGTHRNAYRQGFLEAMPDNLPQPLPARADYAEHAAPLARLSAQGNSLAQRLARLLDAPGQTYLQHSEELLRHPLDKFTVAELLNNIGTYFNAGLDTEPAAAELVAALPALAAEVAAMRAMAQVGEPLITPVIAKTTASGTLLRRKLETVLAPVFDHYAVLRATRG